MNKNDKDLRSCSKAGNEYGAIEATIDGAKVKNLQDYRVQSDFFDIHIPNDNIYHAKPGIYRVLVDGFSVFRAPKAWHT